KGCCDGNAYRPRHRPKDFAEGSPAIPGRTEYAPVKSARPSVSPAFWPQLRGITFADQRFPPERSAGTIAVVRFAVKTSLCSKAAAPTGAGPGGLSWRLPDRPPVSHRVRQPLFP